MIRRAAHLLIIFCAAVSAGCATVEGIVPAEMAPTPSGTIQGGVAKLDITPLPGYPLGGHSTEARVSRGYWLRLKARAIYLEDANGSRLVLVAADLWSIPGGLADRVAVLLGGARPDCRLHRDSFVIAATHTHQSPGNFATSVAYNMLAQPGMGFDPELFDFLARRIAKVIEKACAGRQPVVLGYASGIVERFARNRSMGAFVRNPDAAELVNENRNLPDGAPHGWYPHEDSYRAVDPALRVLRISPRAAPQSALAIAAFVAVHPTTLSHDMTAYSGDLFGAAALRAEQATGATVAIFNGPQGDVSPAWAKQNRAETLRLGNLLAARIESLGDATFPIEGSIERRFAIRPLADACYRGAGGEPHCTDSSAVPGVAVLGGAEDGRTTWTAKGWEEGRTGYYNERQGDKHSAFDLSFNPRYPPLGFTWLAKRLLAPPASVPLGVYWVGPLLIGTLPGEFTTMAGRRIRQALQTASGAREVFLIGLANEYVSYFATPEEYSAQHYEGASTLYGPASVPLVGAELRALAAQAPATAGSGAARSFQYSSGLIRRFEPRDALGHKARSYDFADIEVDLSTGMDNSAELPRSCWPEVARSMGEAVAQGLSTTPSVRVETVAALPRVVDSDEGSGVLVYLDGADGAGMRWCASWLDHRAARAADAGSRFRFVVTRLDGSSWISAPF